MATSFALGLVIKIVDYGATDQVVTILTAQEKLSFIALGVRKMTSKNRIAIGLGNLIEIEFFKARLQNRLSKLKKATLHLQLPLLDGDTPQVVQEIILKLIKIPQADSKLWYAIEEAWAFLGKTSNHHVKVFVLTRLLSVYGYWPIWDRCHVCQKRHHIIDFAFYQGGFSCIHHTKNERPLMQLKAFQALGKSFQDYQQVDELLNFEIYQELLAFLQSQNIY